MKYISTIKAYEIHFNPITRRFVLYNRATCRYHKPETIYFDDQAAAESYADDLCEKYQS